MPAITVSNESGKTVITRRQNGRAWILGSLHLFYFCFILALPVLAVYRVLTDLIAHRDPPSWVYVLGVAFGAKAWWYGQALYKLLAAKSVIVLQGGTIQIACGQLAGLDEVGTYSVSSLTDLQLESGQNLMLPAGRVYAKAANSPINLAECISDSDGNELIHILCDYYAFATPEPTPSPAVVRW